MISTINLKEGVEAKKTKQQVEREREQPLFMDPADQDKSRSESFHSHTRQNKNDVNNNTLGSLTKKFVQLIKGSPNQIIEIQQASQRLDIQKRRIYDITNVLEGIGYIQKLGKNLMKWVGGQQGAQLEMQVNRLQQQSEQIQKDMQYVEMEIAELKYKLKELSNQNTHLNYLTKEDIILIMKGMKVKSVLLFIGGNGDQLEILSNPDKKTSQWTIQSRSTLSKLFYCRLIDDNTIEIGQSQALDSKNALLKENKIEEKKACEKQETFLKHTIQERNVETRSIFQHELRDFLLPSQEQQQDKQELNQEYPQRFLDNNDRL